MTSMGIPISAHAPLFSKRHGTDRQTDRWITALLNAPYHRQGGLQAVQAMKQLSIVYNTAEI